MAGGAGGKAREKGDESMWRGVQGRRSCGNRKGLGLVKHKLYGPIVGTPTGALPSTPYAICSCREANGLKRERKYHWSVAKVHVFAFLGTLVSVRGWSRQLFLQFSSEPPQGRSWRAVTTPLTHNSIHSNLKVPFLHHGTYNHPLRRHGLRRGGGRPKDGRVPLHHPSRSSRRTTRSTLARCPSPSSR